MTDTRNPSPLVSQIERVEAKPKKYSFDLRIHTPASLGYMALPGIDTAPALVRLAQAKGLDMIALTDFYSGAFIDRVVAAAAGSGMTVIPGVTIRTVLDACDDVVLTCLFPEGSGTAGIERFLEVVGVPQAEFGKDSYILNRPFAETMKVIDAFNGIAIPSRLDKTPAQFNVVPRLVEEFGFRVFDLAYPESAHFFKRRWPKEKFSLFSFSNAQALAQIGSRYARVKLAEPGFAGIASMAIRAEGLQAIK